MPRFLAAKWALHGGGGRGRAAGGFGGRAPGWPRHRGSHNKLVLFCTISEDLWGSKGVWGAGCGPARRWRAGLIVVVVVVVINVVIVIIMVVLIVVGNLSKTGSGRQTYLKQVLEQVLEGKPI